MRQFDHPVTLRRVDGRQLVISAMSQTDVEALASLYQKVWIRSDTYRRMLNSLEPHNFERSGGMFLIQDQESLARLLEDPSEYVWVAREGGRFLGALWCGLRDAKYSDPSRIVAFPGCEELPSRIRRGLNEKTLYFSKEILIAPEARGLRLPEALLKNAMRFFHERGYRESCGEVYFVHALRDEAGEHPVNLFNSASARMLSRTGCRLEGAFPPCVVHADGFDAVVSMRIVHWDLYPSLEASQKTLAAAGIIMENSK